MRRVLFFSVACAALASVSACSLFVDLGDLSGGDTDGMSSNGCDGTTCTSTDGSSGSDASGDGGGVLEAGPCDKAGSAGPRMVSADGFCIDSTEVTVKQYTDFVNASPSVDQPVECAWNTGFAPEMDGDNGCNPGGVDPSTHGDYPMSCIDWCDAWAYCTWAGKHLCGDIDGGAQDFGDPNGSSSEWYLACSTGGAHAIATGATYDGGCNVSSSDPIAVASDTSCVGGYPGLYDMGGNLEEWMNSCDTDGQDSDAGASSDDCHEIGDAYDYSPNGFARCDTNDSDHRDARYPEVGFRCCASLP